MALSSDVLLFLGLSIEDRDFRVLLRSIINLEGRSETEVHNNVAAQVFPEEGFVQAPERARRYLEKFFQTEAKVNIYWGSADDFIQELARRWQESGGKL
jgi:hypothetical protein